MKSKDLQLSLLYPARLPFKIQGEIRSALDKKKRKEFVNTKPALQQCLRAWKEKKKKKENNKKEEKEKKKEENSLTMEWHYIHVYQ